MVFPISDLAKRDVVMPLAAGLLSLSALLFPFSVAATNVALGLTLVAGLLSGLWWQGAQQCWRHYRSLTIIVCTYVGILLLGLLWSLDAAWGMHVVGRSWFWLLIPVVVAITAERKWRVIFLVSLSSGLTLNLVYCLLQMFGYVEVTTDGSGVADATGHIGHIGFGFVYGIWAAWLIHLGYHRKAWQRWGAWGLAVWSYVMVFTAQGRAGQLVAVVLLLCVSLRMLRSYTQSARWGMLVIVIGVCGLSAVLLSDENRWQQFIQEMEHLTLHDDVSVENMMATSTGQRVYMIKVSLGIWKKYPLLGVGTGGLPLNVKQWQQNHHETSALQFVHPHNQYILDFVRWSIVGLLCLLLLLVLWGREGWRMDWHKSAAAPFVFLTAMALIVDGMFGPTLEEHFSGVLSALLLGSGLSVVRSGKASSVDANAIWGMRIMGKILQATKGLLRHR